MRGGASGSEPTPRAKEGSIVPGFADLVLILIVVLVVFGSGKLPQIATAVGRTILSLRKRKPTDPKTGPGSSPTEDPDE